MRRFFQAPKSYVEADGLDGICTSIMDVYIYFLYGPMASTLRLCLTIIAVIDEIPKCTVKDNPLIHIRFCGPSLR